MGPDWAWLELTVLDSVWPCLDEWTWLSRAELATFPLLLHLAAPSTCHLSLVPQGSSLETYAGRGWGRNPEMLRPRGNMRGSKFMQGLVFRAPYNITVSLGT